MKSKLGIPETSSAISILCMPLLILQYINRGINISGGAYWINYLVCSLIVYIFICISKNFISDMKKNRKITDIFLALFIIYLFLNTIYSYSILSDSLYSLMKNNFIATILGFIPAIAAIICVWLGIEAITRCSYVSFVFISIIIVFIAIITFNGWDIENFYPVLGNDYKSTFFDTTSIGIYSPLLMILALDSRVSDSYITLKKAYFKIFLVGLAFIFLCTIIIPYPMSDLYDFSLVALFSIAKSGSFFHRFEIILVTMMLLITINALSLSIYVISAYLSKISMVSDNRIYALMIGTVLFYVKFTAVFKGVNIYLFNVIAILITLCIISVSLFKIKRKV